MPSYWQDREGAERLLRLAYPVAAAFYDQLGILGGAHGQNAQRQSLDYSGLQIDRMLHFQSSLFSQWVHQTTAVPPELLVQSMRVPMENGTAPVGVNRTTPTGNQTAFA